MTKPASAATASVAPRPSLFSDPGSLAQNLVEAFLEVRNETERRAAPLSPEDQLIQSMPDASPAKWHRAHTTWFFEQFLLGEHSPGYTVFHPDYAFLFNSYYVSAGPRHARHQRGHLTRPSADEVTAYRRHVDAAVVKFFQTADEETLAKLAPLVEVGLNHEQQHQELMLTDILHAFAQNPIPPAYDPAWRFPASSRWRRSHGSPSPRASTPSAMPATASISTMKSRRIARWSGRSNWRATSSPMPNGSPSWPTAATATPTLWLMDGFAAVNNEEWQAPGHWRQIDGEWQIMTLGGLKPVDPDAPVCHVSYYEADAFARWSGKHLPTEMEWEVAARAGQLNDAFGIVWQWTRSAYSPYPGYRAIEGALGEYNGKFMVNQLVLRGSSLATPDGHSRVTYRNFFYPHHRWQFTGLRLADYTA